ncbi:MAG: hypothetical protein ACK5UI_04560 [Bacteroidota bacterium]|jgi:hypothetical protein
MNTHEQHTAKVKALLEQQLQHEEIKSTLLQDGVDETTLNELMKQVFKHQNAKRVNKGLGILVLGLLFLFAGFFCTICFHNSTLNYQISLYGFTSLGITLVFAGMIMIFG